MENSRQPIVTVLGHVDHGKTTLLDAIRKTSVAAREAGGITQSIGASVIETLDKRKITFIDTPGHAAFEKMRSRGATVADVVVLVVAADDGVKPQTEEALKHIQNTKTPFVVAFTKTDMPGANLESAKSQMEKEGILFEGRGGDTPSVAVSAKEGKGIDELLEMILLVADVSEIKGSPEDDFEGVVIETNKDNRGVVVSLVVRAGTLSVGQEIFAEQQSTKVRGLFNDAGKPVKKVLPGEPTLMLGFREIPPVGSLLGAKPVGAPEAGKKRRETPESEFLFVVKAGSVGSLEAVETNFPSEAGLISSGVGEVTESDIFTAKAGEAPILAFDTKVSSGVKKLAQTEGVSIFEFNIIYELIEKVEEVIKQGEVKILGEAEVLAEFPFNGKRVAGSKIKSGNLAVGKKVTLKRKEEEIGQATITSMRKQKDEISVAKEGEECGILLKPQLDFKIGDMLVSVAQDG